jgi:hypothetical protein
MANSLPWNYRPPQAPASPEVPKHQSKKNTRKWCKGKVGVLHQPKWRAWTKLPYRGKVDDSTSLEFVCERCGKSLDFWVAWQGLDSAYERPTIGSSEPLKKKTKPESGG